MQGDQTPGPDVEKIQLGVVPADPSSYTKRRRADVPSQGRDLCPPHRSVALWRRDQGDGHGVESSHCGNASRLDSKITRVELTS